MKQKATKNYSGITICDSIVVSVRKKRRNLRRLEAVIIAVIGFVSVIMSFLEMFSFSFKTVPVIYAAVICSVIYISISLCKNKGLWLYLGSILIFALGIIKYLKQITNGFKYVYNIIYSTSNHTEINYYKLLNPDNEEYCVTVFFIFCIWLLAAVIYFFTVYKPNPVIPVIVTFPVIEIGLYNGINLSVMWGMLTVGYWLALLSMCTIDMGEYSGGSSGFVRKGNLFFPKRQMRLKVTEKCALLIIASIAAVTLISVIVMNAVGYERSEKINQRRAAIKQAVTSFTFDDFASSVSALTESLGFTFEYESHKLGTSSRVSYKNETDLTVTFDKKYDGAVYLKGYSGSVYEDNEWFSLSDDVLKSEKQMFDEFEEYNTYPQDFPHTFVSGAYPGLTDITMWIEPKNKKNKAYAPYGTDNYGSISYKYDTVIAPQKKNGSEYSYKFIGINAELAAGMLGSPTRLSLTPDLITDTSMISSVEEFCSSNDIYSYDNYFPVDSEINNALISSYDLYNDGNLMITSLLENKYRTFVYENYLQVPDNSNMDEVRAAFSDILEESTDADTASKKLDLLLKLRDRINSMAEYSLSPGKTPSNRDFVNYFLLENHKGYCTHYATAGVLLARMAGIPARYSTGYIVVGDDFNDSNKEKNGSYTIDVQDNRSHAWTEIYLDGFGWVPFEFTAGYSNMSINTNTTAENTVLSQTQTTTSTPKASDTSRNTTQSKNTNRSTTTKAVTTAFSETTAPNDSGIGSSGSEGKFSLSETQKNILLILATAAVIVFLVWLRRYLILLVRKKRFNDSDKRKSIASIYNYVEQLLERLEIRRENMSYADFAEYVEKNLHGTYFNENDFHTLLQTALQGSFDKTEPEKSEIEFALNMAQKFSRTVYSNSNAFRKFCLKYIYALI